MTVAHDICSGSAGKPACSAVHKHAVHSVDACIRGGSSNENFSSACIRERNPDVGNNIVDTGRYGSMAFFHSRGDSVHSGVVHRVGTLGHVYYTFRARVVGYTGFFKHTLLVEHVEIVHQTLVKSRRILVQAVARTGSLNSSSRPRPYFLESMHACSSCEYGGRSSGLLLLQKK